jgi:UPF0716 protein FxsA
MPWLFLLLPWVELWTLIELGSRTSALTALAYVFLAFVVGMALIRRQGLVLLRQMQQQNGASMLGPQMLMDDLALVSCGLLLMIPGLVTDFMALLFLIGPLRRRLLGNRVEVHQSYSNPRQHGDAQGGEQVTLEGEFKRLDD